MTADLKKEIEQLKAELARVTAERDKLVGQLKARPRTSLDVIGGAFESVGKLSFHK